MSDKWVRDTGLVFALVFLLVGVKVSTIGFVLCAVFLLALLFAPLLLWPLARLWLFVAEVLGQVMNKVFFGLVFYVVVVPVGLLKRVFEGDQRDLGPQPDKSSAFYEREKLVVAADLAKPF
jgi:hypothetical protein